jgi:mono/diheme cytochrome c family protein
MVVQKGESGCTQSTVRALLRPINYQQDHGSADMRWILATLVLASLNAFSVEAKLEILTDRQQLSLSQSQLLSRRDVRTISIRDSAYQQGYTRFKAIPIANLFRGVAIPDSAIIQSKATDGFAASLEKARLFSTDPKASRAFLAIEDPRSPWPDLPGKTTSAGPFYLVWMNPKASAVSAEEWPYQIASFTILTDARSVFPRIYPAADAAPAVQNGFKSFQRNCFPCHRMNGNGAGSIGPDLNLPMNPTEYLDASALKALIRDPGSVRTWPQRAMSGFSETAIPDEELADLIAYLRHMSKRRASAAP